MAKLTEKEFQEKVLSLAKQGLTSEKIGLELKKEKIYAKEFEKISKILKENNLYSSADMANLKKSIEKLEKHHAKHHGDRTYARSLAIKKAKLRKMEKLAA